MPSPLNRERQSFPQTVLGKLDTHMQDLIPSTKTNSKCTKDFNMKPKTIQPLEEKSGGTSLAVQWLRLKASTAGGVSSIPGQGTKTSPAMQHSQTKKTWWEKPHDIGFGYDFLDMRPKARTEKLKNFCASKDTIRVTRQPIEWEKIFANHIHDTGFIFRLCKELPQLHTHTQNQLKHRQRTVFKHCKWAHNHVKRCSTSLIIREMQIKIRSTTS